MGRLRHPTTDDRCYSNSELETAIDTNLIVEDQSNYLPGHLPVRICFLPHPSHAHHRVVSPSFIRQADTINYNQNKFLLHDVFSLTFLDMFKGNFRHFTSSLLKSSKPLKQKLLHFFVQVSVMMVVL